MSDVDTPTPGHNGPTPPVDGERTRGVVHNTIVIITFRQRVRLVDTELCTAFRTDVVPHDPDETVAVRSGVFVFVSQCVHHFVYCDPFPCASDVLEGDALFATLCVTEKKKGEVEGIYSGKKGEVEMGDGRIYSRKDMF